MDFADNKMDFSDLISRLMQDEENKKNTLAILRDSYGLYEKDSPLLIDEIRRRAGNDDFSKGIRELLVNLAGPFKREYHHYYDITIREIVEAINNLEYEHEVPKEFRELSNKEVGIFKIRPVDVYLTVSAPGKIPDEEAAVCRGVGSDYYRRHLLIIHEDSPPLLVFANHFFIDVDGGDKPCIMINPNAAKKLLGKDAVPGLKYEARIHAARPGYQFNPLLPEPSANVAVTGSD